MARDVASRAQFEQAEAMLKTARAQLETAELQAHSQAACGAGWDAVDVDTGVWAEDRTPTHGYESTREPAMAAFAKSWRRE